MYSGQISLPVGTVHWKGRSAENLINLLQIYIQVLLIVISSLTKGLQMTYDGTLL
jgi:hypothetical protein